MAFDLRLITGSNSGSGIDVQGTVDQLIYAEQAPERLLQQQQQQLDTQAAALTDINAKLSTLEDTVVALRDFSGVTNARLATSSQPAVLTASADASAATGTHVVVVKSLSTRSSCYSGVLATPTTTFNSGSFDLKVGDTTTTIAVDETRNSLEMLATYINGLNLGVTASIVSDANGSRLGLVSNSSGMAGDVTISNNTTDLGFTKAVAGANASVTVDGVPIEMAGNTLTGAVRGVTLNLLNAAPDSPILVTIAPDTNRIRQALNDFVSRYNAVVSAANAQFAWNPITKQAGPLAGDSSLRGIQSALLSSAAYSISGNEGFVNLTSIGIEMENDGTLSINSSKLDDVLANHYAAFTNFMQSVPARGFANHFGAELMRLTDTVDGPLNVSLIGISSTKGLIADQISDFEVRLDARRQQLLDQYSRIDTMLRQFPLLLAQINAQLGALDNGK